MPERLIYLPIESYESRSTEYMSCKHGVYETCFKEAGIKFETIRPWNTVEHIKAGAVVDITTRSSWGFAQINKLLQKIAAGELDPKTDAIFFEDFWTPGFEMLPYAQSLIFGHDKAKQIPVYSFCHAQSTDPHDFTAKMSDWMRPMELGWAKYQSAVMCASKEMVHQWDVGGLPRHKLHVCGLSFNAGAMRRMFNVPVDVQSCGRDETVVFSSRWDTEKNPLFFLALAEHFARTRPSTNFIICTGLPALTSNDPALLQALNEYAHRYKNITVMEGLSKKHYFHILRSAQVQFNCASQDFISYSLLDAMLNGCAPLYPNVLTFPDALNNSAANLYEGRLQSTSHVYLSDAVSKLNALLDSPIDDYSWVWKKYEASTRRKLEAMGFDIDGCGTTPSIGWLNALSVSTIKDYFKE